MPETTAKLLARARSGDGEARSQVLARYAVILGRWATARVPEAALKAAAVKDIVKTNLRNGFEHLNKVEPQREGAFLAHLRHTLYASLRDARRAGIRNQPHANLATPLDLAPLEKALGNELLEIYDVALNALTDQEREAIVLRLEMGFTYQEIAEALGVPTPEATRTVVGGAILKLSESLYAQ